MGRGALLRQYNGAESNVPSLVLTQRFIYVRGGSVVEVSRIRSILVITSKKETLQVIRRVLPNCQVITYSFCFTGAETEIHKIKDDSKIIMQTNLDRRGPRPIPIICHLLGHPPFSRYRLPLTRCYRELANDALSSCFSNKICIFPAFFGILVSENLSSACIVHTVIKVQKVCALSYNLH